MKRLLSVLILFGTSLAVFAQHTLTGNVKDQTGEPVIGATIVLKENQTVGTVTDIDGNFSIEAPKANAMLIVSFIGYATQEVQGKGKGSRTQAG